MVGATRSLAKSIDEGMVAPRSFFKDAFQKQLPLQNETTYFILVNVLDFVMTYILLQSNRTVVEANPVADFFYQRWGFPGMIAFKLGLVAVICVLSQAVALRSIGKARFILITGIIIVSLVVAYSVSLYWR